MKAVTLVPLEEYLRTSYRPDRDYVDGEVLDRNVGERDHARLQREILFFFRMHMHALGVHVFPEQRIQGAANRFRVPDICVVAGPEPDEQIFHQPPLICIEILSQNDSLERMQERIDDYLSFGVRYVWVINPRTQRAWQYTPNGSVEIKDGLLRTENPAIQLPLADMFPPSQN